MSNFKNLVGQKKGFILALFLVFGPAFLLVLISTRGCEHKFKELDDFGVLPNFIAKTASGKTITNKSFQGKFVLYTTLQKTCPDSCAVSFWHIDQMIYQHIRKNQKKLKHVKIVSFVTDGFGNDVKDIKDTEAIVKDQVEAFDPNIWMIVSGEAKKLFTISNNGEKLTEKGEQYFGGEAFQELLLLIDQKNHLRMVLNGKSEGMVRRMKEHIALLDKQYDKEKALKNK